MRIFRLFFLTGLFCGVASGVDLTLSGNTDPSCSAPYVCVFPGTPFDIDVDPFGGGFFRIVNETGTNIIGLTFSLPYYDTSCNSEGGSPALPTLTIDGSFSSSFAGGSLVEQQRVTCDGSVRGQADYSLVLNFDPGVPEAYQFTVSLNDGGGGNVTGSGGWVPGDTTNTAASAPEPGSWLAAFGGLAMVILGLRFQRVRVWNSWSLARVRRSRSFAASRRE